MPRTSSSATFGHDLKRLAYGKIRLSFCPPITATEARKLTSSGDPENRVSLIAKLAGAPKGYVFRERSNAIRIRATLQGIFAVHAKQTVDLARYFQAVAMFG